MSLYLATIRAWEKKKYKSMFKENENVFWMLAIFQMEYETGALSHFTAHIISCKMYNVVSEVIVWTLFLMIYNWKALLKLLSILSK